jgi:hypothetical protein
METTTHSTEQLSDKDTAPSQSDLFADIIDTGEYEKSMKNARVWLYVIAAFQTIMAVVEYNTTDNATVGIVAASIDVFIAMLFAGLAFLSNKNPVAAFTMALVFYVLIVAALIALDPSNAFRGVIFKILIIIALVKANRDARKYVALKQSIGQSI